MSYCQNEENEIFDLESPIVFDIYLWHWKILAFFTCYLLVLDFGAGFNYFSRKFFLTLKFSGKVIYNWLHQSKSWRWRLNITPLEYSISLTFRKFIPSFSTIISRRIRVSLMFNHIWTVATLKRILFASKIEGKNTHKTHNRT